MKFLVDENLPRNLATRLLSDGHDAIDVRKTNKIGLSDEEIIKVAQQESRILITANYKHFANILLFPPKKSPGIVVIRMPHCSINEMIKHTLKAISSLKESDILHSLIILEVHRIRKRT